MTMRFLSLSVILFCTTTSFAAHKPTKDSGQSTQENQSALSTTDAKGLKTDLQRMRALLGQMQRNVAFVSSGDTPLKHQLQLEIEMWQLLLNNIEKKTNEESPQ